MGMKIAVVGATGAVGRVFLKYLEDSNIKVDELASYASPKSEGKVIHFRDKPIRIIPLKKETVGKFDYVFCTVSSSISREFLPLFRDKGAICIDDSSAFRMRPDVPIIIPEVNGDKLTSHKGIISIPNCVVAGIAMALKPLHDAFKVKRVIASSYQSVSGAGQASVAELEDFTRSYVFKDNLTKLEQYEKEMLFNVIPSIPHKKFEPNESGYTDEEEKLIKEVGKILADDSIKVTATCVRVPVFVGHAVSMNIELAKQPTLEEVLRSLDGKSGLALERDSYITPKEAEGKNEVFVSRVRQDNTNKNAWWLWVVTDNLRKGAAYNAFQIFELLSQSRKA